MSVFRVKKSPYFQFDFQIKGYRFYGSTEATNKHDAAEVEKAERAKATRIVSDIRATGRKPLTIGIASDRWFDEHGKHLNDQDLKRQVQWLADTIGRQVMLHDITDDTLSQLIERRRRDVKRAGLDDRGKQLYKPVGPRTINNTTTSLLRRIMRRAKANWNATILREPDWAKHMLPVPKRPVREITVAEEERLDEEESAEFIQFRQFAFIVGLRRRELLLTWPQVDFSNRLFRVIGKGKQPRIIPMSQDVYDLLWSLRGNHPLHVFTFVAQRTRKCPKTGTQFVTGKRYPMTYYGIGSQKRRSWSRAGVDARLHDTRHTAGMRTLRATGNLKAVQRLLGHSKIETTSNFYTEALVDDVRAAMESTSRYTESQKNSQTANRESKKPLGRKA